MAIRRLKLQNFTVFRKAEFEFAPGINVLIGENSTGKTHVLKVLYAIQKDNWLLHRAGNASSRDGTLVGVFRPEQGDAQALKSQQRPGRLRVRVEDSAGGSCELSLNGFLASSMTAYAERGRPVFIPTKDILSVLPGLAETIRNRELEFDDTYADLAEALNLPALRGPALRKIQPTLRLAELALGGRETQTENRFYLTLHDRTFEAHLVAEGLRKAATLTRLIRNGRLGPGTTLFWDEPEANFNPVLLRKIVEVLLALARGGVQIFLASHDYLLTQTLSLAAEHPTRETPPMRFFSLVPSKTGDVRVESADTIAGIADNPILREHARQYDLESAAFARDSRG